MQLKRINDVAEELVNEGHSHSDEIRRRQDAANLLWNKIQNLWKTKQRQLVSCEWLTRKFWDLDLIGKFGT